MANRAFVLSGGGAAGSAQFGIIKALLQADIRPQKLFGTSAGALNSFGLSYLGVDGLEAMWRGMRGMGDVFSLHWLPIYSGLYSSAPLRKLLSNVQANRVPTIPFAVFATNLLTGSLVQADSSKSNILDYTIGSASIPVVADNVNVDGLRLADGGIVDNWPLRQAVAEGFDEIYIINCLSEELQTAPMQTGVPLVDSALMAINAATDQIMNSDLVYRDLQSNIVVKTITPSKTVVNVFDFNEQNIAAGITQGFGDGLKFLNSR